MPKPRKLQSSSSVLEESKNETRESRGSVSLPIGVGFKSPYKCEDYNLVSECSTGRCSQFMHYDDEMFEEENAYYPSTDNLGDETCPTEGFGDSPRFSCHESHGNDKDGEIHFRSGSTDVDPWHQIAARSVSEVVCRIVGTTINAEHVGTSVPLGSISLTSKENRKRQDMKGGILTSLSRSYLGQKLASSTRRTLIYQKCHFTPLTLEVLPSFASSDAMVRKRNYCLTMDQVRSNISQDSSLDSVSHTEKPSEIVDTQELQTYSAALDVSSMESEEPIEQEEQMNVVGLPATGEDSPVRKMGSKTGTNDPKIPSIGRKGSSMCLDSNQNALFVFGGFDGHQETNSVMKIDLMTATAALCRPRSENASGELELPPPRQFSSCCLYGDLMYVVFGGTKGNHGDIWAFNVRTHVWSEIKARGQLPGGRCGHSVCVTQDYSKLLVYGGWSEGVGQFPGVWVLHLRERRWSCAFAWDNLAKGPPHDRCAHVATVYNDDMFAFGGYQTPKKVWENDLWVWNITSEQWRQPTSDYTKGRPPPPIVRPLASKAGNEWYIFDCKRFQLHSFNLETGTWSFVVLSTACPFPPYSYPPNVVVCPLNSLFPSTASNQSKMLKGLKRNVSDTTHVNRSYLHKKVAYSGEYTSADKNEPAFGFGMFVVGGAIGPAYNVSDMILLGIGAHVSDLADVQMMSCTENQKSTVSTVRRKKKSRNKVVGITKCMEPPKTISNDLDSITRIPVSKYIYPTELTDFDEPTAPLALHGEMPYREPSAFNPSSELSSSKTDLAKGSWGEIWKTSWGSPISSVARMSSKSKKSQYTLSEAAARVMEA